MRDIKVCFSSNSDEYSTPFNLFNELNKEFNFTLDPCCTKENKKCTKFYTKQENGLTKEWKNEIVFYNPPYSNIKEWVKKCFEEWKKGCVVVLLIPSRTDTKYFHNYILPYAELRFLKGRLKFNDLKGSAPFPSVICVFK